MSEHNFTHAYVSMILGMSTLVSDGSTQREDKCVYCTD